MLIAKPADIPSHEITPEAVFWSRRRFMQGVAAGSALVATGGPAFAALSADGRSTDEALTPEAIVTGYNNFYEFGMDKSDPARYSDRLTTRPWSVKVSGEATRTGEFDIEDLVKGLTPEERIYRFRCVEAWSMVVPWMGIPLKDILTRLEPTSNAKYVELTTLLRPSEMPGQKSLFTSIDWPYVEGLRIDEAMHDLTLMVTGVYGKPLPNQNGAPWRLMVPWKYGFKSVKSVVGIRFTRTQPKNTWNLLAPDEYGFYANVNPAVDHPRWSQASERRLPSTLLSQNRIPTLPFNGYGEQVASLYSGMDLKRHF